MSLLLMKPAFPVFHLVIQIEDLRAKAILTDWWGLSVLFGFLLCHYAMNLKYPWWPDLDVKTEKSVYAQQEVSFV